MRSCSSHHDNVSRRRYQPQARTATPRCASQHLKHGVGGQRKYALRDDRTTLKQTPLPGHVLSIKSKTRARFRPLESPHTEWYRNLVPIKRT